MFKLSDLNNKRRYMTRTVELQGLEHSLEET